MFTAVIVDDEARNIALFSYYLEKYCPNINVVASFSKKSNALRYLTSNKPDILFLDIVLDEGSGFDVLDEVGHEDMQVVMCTAHDEFALRAIRYQVVDYLLKPLEIQDLISTVDKIEKKLSSNIDKKVYDASLLAPLDKLKLHGNQRFAFSDRNAIDFISIEDVLCIETQKGKDKCEVILSHHAKGEYLLVNETIFEMEKKFIPFGTFFRVSRTCIVCITAIASILRSTQYVLVLTNGKRVIIPRKGYKELIGFIEDKYQTSL